MSSKLRRLGKHESSPGDEWLKKEATERLHHLDLYEHQQRITRLLDTDRIEGELSKISEFLQACLVPNNNKGQLAIPEQERSGSSRPAPGLGLPVLAELAEKTSEELKAGWRSNPGYDVADAVEVVERDLRAAYSLGLEFAAKRIHYEPAQDSVEGVMAGRLLVQILRERESASKPCIAASKPPGLRWIDVE